MTEYEKIQKMHHQVYLLKQNQKRPISKWQKARQKMEMLRDDLDLAQDKKMIKAFDLTKQALLNSQVMQENDPLKKIALEKMNGEPVWVVSEGHDGRWGIVDTSMDCVTFFVDGEVQQEYWFASNYIFKYKKIIFDHSELLKEQQIHDTEDKT